MSVKSYFIQRSANAIRKVASSFHHYVTTFVHKTAFTSWTYSIIKSCKHDFISLICPWLNYFATMLTILPGT